MRKVCFANPNGIVIKPDDAKIIHTCIAGVVVELPQPASDDDDSFCVDAQIKEEEEFMATKFETELELEELLEEKYTGDISLKLDLYTGEIISKKQIFLSLENPLKDIQDDFKTVEWLLKKGYIIHDVEHTSEYISYRDEEIATVKVYLLNYKIDFYTGEIC